eukprot:31089-Pelagococcus_subviridis.AAC.26
MPRREARDGVADVTSCQRNSLLSLRVRVRPPVASQNLLEERVVLLVEVIPELVLRVDAGEERDASARARGRRRRASRRRGGGGGPSVAFAARVFVGSRP